MKINYHEIYKNKFGYFSGGILTINLDCLKNNYKLISKISKPAETSAVVKANAYGVGAKEVASSLYEVGCRLFFVAHLSEALFLKSCIPSDSRIAILNDIHPGMEKITAKSGFLPVLNSLSSIKNWENLCKKNKHRFPVILQLDIGMSRLGLSLEEIEDLTKNPEIFYCSDVKYIISHLTSSSRIDDSINIVQLNFFKKLVKKLPQSNLSLSNSGGIGLGKDYIFDLVRPGISLYGCSPNKNLDMLLNPVVQLDARVIQTRFLKKGTKIGYDGIYTTNKSMNVATISVGYGDGWMFSLGNRGSAFFSGHKIPILGKISMDSIVLEITHLEKDAPKRGDLVELIGPNQTLKKIAKDAGTIPYEILTSLGNRYERKYIKSNIEMF